MKSLLLFALALAAPSLALAGFKPGLGWPEVVVPFFHATTQSQGDARCEKWRATGGCTIQTYRDTGSMHPVLQGGRELLVMEFCGPLLPLAVGQIVLYDRGDNPRVLHYIAAISRDGTQVFLSGVNNRSSDGWFSRKKIAWVVREIITVQEPIFRVSPAGQLAETR